jgi:hypothetical protein
VIVATRLAYVVTFRQLHCFLLDKPFERNIWKTIYLVSPTRPAMGRNTAVAAAYIPTTPLLMPITMS